MATVEFRFTGVRLEGRTLEGVAMSYSDVATLPGGAQERFEPGSFEDVEQVDCVLNVQHDRGRPLARSLGGGLVLSDSPTQLSIKATLPETRESNDVIELVKGKVLRGLSVGFIALQERFESGVRVIERAALRSIAVCDSGAYPSATVSAREETARPAEAARRASDRHRRFLL